MSTATPKPTPTPPPTLRADELMPKKLSLWHTNTFRPIITIDELDPIMTAAGFFPLPIPKQQPPQQQQQQLVWREYVFVRSSCCHSSKSSVVGGGGDHQQQLQNFHQLRPRLPYPRIDGLHLMVYKAFLLLLQLYLSPTDVSNLFHVRTMSLSRVHDRIFDKTYRPMKDCEIDDEGIIVYREGTLDQMTKMVCSRCSSDNSSSLVKCSKICDDGLKKPNYEDNEENPSNMIYLVPLKDLFPHRDLVSLS